MRNNALLFPGRQFWLRRGKNEKWVFFDWLDDAVDDVFTKVGWAVDRLGIISQISKFHHRGRVMMRRGKRYDLEFWNGIGVFCWAAFKTLYTCVSRKALTLEKNYKIQVVCIFTLFENSANISKNWVWRDFYKGYPLLTRGRNLVWAQPKINMFPYIHFLAIFFFLLSDCF